MIIMSEFFIHLPSNACPSIYPLNTASDYAIQLNDPIQLNGGGWSVALNDISYTTDWKTIEHETLRCGVPQVRKKYSKRIQLDNGSYTWKWTYYDVNDIISAYPVVNANTKGELLCKLCAKLVRLSKPSNIFFGFYRRKHEQSFWKDVPVDDSVINFKDYDYKVQIDIRRPNIFLQFPDDIVNVLGFRQRKSFFNQQTFTAHMDSTEPIEPVTLKSSQFIMDTLRPFLQCQRHVLKPAGQVMTIQQLVDKWKTLSIGCELMIGDDGRASIVKTSAAQSIIYVNNELLSWLHLYDQVLSFPVAYTNPDAEPLNLETQVGDKEWIVQVYDVNLSAEKYQYQWLQLNKVLIDLPAHSYQTPAELILDLNRKLESQNVYIKLEQLEDKKTKLNVAPYYFILIAPRLQQILGFESTRSFSGGSFISDVPINLQQPRVQKMSVYTNIIDYVHVGSQMEQLLRTFLHENGDSERIVMKEFLHNIYVPVRETCISCIKIIICDENFHEIPFHNGKTMVTLHFKQRC